MPQNYAGRLTLIVIVLLVALFGFYPLSDGIFSLDKVFDPSTSFSQKLNLKPGIDIAGGTSLLYEIKPPPGGWRGGQGTLAEQVASLLKKRVDPTGTRNLIWRPQGDTRLEIQLPRSSMTGEGGVNVKTEYRDLTRQLQSYNINFSQVVDSVERLKGDQRAAALERLARGSEARKNLFAQLRSLFDKMNGLQTQIADLRKAAKPDDTKLTLLSQELAQTRIEYTDAKGRIEQTNLQPSDLEGLLETTQANAASQEARRREFESLKVRFPERKALIEKFQEIYPKYVASKGQIDDAADLKRLLRGSGVLEFHILVDNPQVEQPDMIRRIETEGPTVKANDQSRWYIVDRPEEFHRQTWTNPRDGRKYTLAWVTPDKSMVHREGTRDWALQRAYPTPSQRGDLIVGFEFDDSGAALFSQLTGANINKPLAVVLDQKIISAPNIRSQIGKSGTIDGGERGYTEGERTYLINTLNAGSLPAQLEDEPISERQVGPQLGESNLKSGLYSCVIGLVVIAIFMVVYYHLSGVVAAVALLFNMVLIIGILAMMGATFTLPGIAGLVLTIGVSVDANVLIFERLREEERRGLSLKLALRNAYDRAFTAILDSNVTTAITSAFLVYFGSEEVKGFGLTLLIGILCSMFSALFVTKTIFAIMLEKFGLRKLGSFPLNNLWWERLLHPQIDWMGKIPWFLAFSILFGVTGLIAFGQNAYRGTLMDVEFASGTEVQFTTKEPMRDGEVRDLVAKRPKEIPQPSVVAVGNNFGGNKFKEFSVVTANADRRQVEAAILDAMQGKLDVPVPSKFEFFSNKPAETFAPALQANVIRPIVLKDNRFQIDGREVPDAARFADGVAVELRNLAPALKVEDIRARIEAAVLDAGDRSLTQFEVQRFDGELDEQRPTDRAIVMVGTKDLGYSKGASDWRDKLALPFWKAINAGVGREVSLQKVTNFDAQVAGDTQRAALLATLFSIVAIMIWIWVRFGDMKYGTATVAAMIHDTILVVGAVGLAHWLADTAVGNILGIEAFRVNMTLVAAILTIMGYSMVDTIVVFDRIRENRGKYGSISRQLINDSVNQTLSRTLLTAGTTMATVLVMYIWGGPAIHGFTFVLFIGILIGTYSSIAIAAPILLIGAKQPAGQPAKTDASASSPVGAVRKVGA